MNYESCISQNKAVPLQADNRMDNRQHLIAAK